MRRRRGVLRVLVAIATLGIAGLVIADWAHDHDCTMEINGGYSHVTCANLGAVGPFTCASACEKLGKQLAANTTCVTDYGSSGGAPCSEQE